MKFLRFILPLAFFGSSLFSEADVTLPAIFSDHAVLQKSNTVPIWGNADPDEKVTVTLNNLSAETKASADGNLLLVWNSSVSQHHRTSH